MKKFLALCISLILVMGLIIVPTAAANAEEVFVDDLVDLSKVSEKTGNWELFGDHPEFGCSVAGKPNGNTPFSLVYKFADKNITAIELGMAVDSGFFNKAQIAAEVMAGGKWQKAALTFGDFKDIAGKPATKKLVTGTAELPAGVTAVKFVLSNDVGWTMFLDKVTLKLGAAAPAVPEDGSEIFEDDLDHLEKVSEKVGHWEMFPAHPEFGCSVAGKGNGNDPYSLIYKFTDKTVSDIDIQLAVDKGFFNKAHITVEVMAGGKWEKVALTFGEFKDIAGKPAAKKLVNGTAKLPEGVSEVKVTLSNDVGWTMFLDKIKMTLKAPEKADGDKLVDDLKDLSKVSEKTGNWELFGDHPEFGCSVAGKPNGNDPYSLVYKFTDKAVTDIDIQLAVDKGFFNKAQITAEVMANGKWEKVALTFGEFKDIAGKPAAKKLVNGTAKLPEGVSSVKVTLLNDVGWTMFIDKITMTLKASEVKPVDPKPEPENENIVKDSFANFNFCSARTANWECFPNHPQILRSVIGRTNADSPSYMYFSFDGKSLVSGKLQLVIMEKDLKLADEIAVEVQDVASNEWKQIAVETGKITPIEGCNFSEVLLTVKEFPQDTLMMRVNFKNQLAWAAFLDEIEIETKATDKKLPVRSWPYEDKLDDLSKVADHSKNLEFFNPHEESKLNVVGKTNAKKGFVTYKNPGKGIKDFDIKLQVAPAFFLPSRDLLIQYKVNGKEDWEKAVVLIGAAEKINDTFSTVDVTSAVALPENVEEIRVNLYNDVAWTLMIESVKLDYEDVLSPQTGNCTENAAVLLSTVILISAASIIFSKKKIEA